MTSRPYGHHMEQVVDHIRLWAMCFDIHFIGYGHVDCNGVNTCGRALGVSLEDRARGLTRAPLTDPGHLTIDRIDHHSGVAMPFMQGKFIHCQIAQR